ncbi:hypothetical protein CEUSTIGMA_g7843.t1 [Chlamydomonas eustigma]|uniref:Ribosomal protein S14 n=1 Tax=Chlamydomonas eustigma TaxID=1157962 RepID=A0A250XBG0_9CHLO|nr:hypothetical protein CEUSTIGMA_g7843.t1 [Chlamydomonas eustigma]|eukprot:GAX80404.1 hypothetical protein CEUSTIGMA_g7843.t1 [Chlamydomonas eustigma]
MYFRLPNIAHVLGSRRIQRDHFRRLAVQEHEAERTLYKAMTHDQSLPLDIRLQVQRLFETEMPRDAAANRVKNRCVLTGRSRSVHRFSRLSRIMVRQLAHYGLLPGVTKATW